MNRSESIKTITAILLKLQKTMEAVVKEEVNPFYNSKYADLNSFMDVCKKPLNEAGILVLQPIGHDETGEFIETILLHVETGEFISTQSKLVVTTDPQKQGSAITYMRRYSLQSLLFMQAVDDDGNTASSVSKGTTAPNLPKYEGDTVSITDDSPVWKCPECFATKTPFGKVFHKPTCKNQEGR